MKLKNLEKLNRHLSRHIGLNFYPGRRADLERGINKAASEFGFDQPQQCVNWLLEAPLDKKQIEVLSSILTIGETYFFRQQDSFDLLRLNILPAILQSDRPVPNKIRIWIAACSSGEEAYSVAMLLDRMGKQVKGLNIALLATDINIKALEKAESGIYTQWAFRNTPPWVQNNYFTPVDKKKFEILPRIRDMVKFEYLNLAEDNYPSLVSNTNGMDIIFCRNVLMYFASDRAKEVLKRIHKSLVTGGWLIMAPTDAFHLTGNTLFDQHPSHTSIYRKNTAVPLPDLSIEESMSFPQSADFPIEQPPPEPSSTVYSTGAEHLPGVPVNNVDSHQPKEEKDILKDILIEARELFTTGNYLAVIQLLQPLIEKNTNGSVLIPDICLLMARTHANLGKLDDALDWSERALTINKLDTHSHYLKAVILMEQGKSAEAVHSLRRCIYIDPDFILGHFTLGNLYYQDRNTNQALRSFNNALELINPLPADTVVSIEEGLFAGRLKDIIDATVEMIQNQAPSNQGALND